MHYTSCFCHYTIHSFIQWVLYSLMDLHWEIRKHFRLVNHGFCVVFCCASLTIYFENDNELLVDSAICSRCQSFNIVLVTLIPILVSWCIALAWITGIIYLKIQLSTCRWIFIKKCHFKICIHQFVTIILIR